MQIVIVDDNRVNVALLKVLARQLTDQPAAEFTDPVVALDWCLTHPFDLLLVDYMMPDLDGLAFVARLRAQADKADVPVLMVTAEAKKENIIAAAQAGASGYIVKPFTAATLAEKLQKIFDKMGA